MFVVSRKSVYVDRILCRYSKQASPIQTSRYISRQRYDLHQVRIADARIRVQPPKFRTTPPNVSRHSPIVGSRLTQATTEPSTWIGCSPHRLNEEFSRTAGEAGGSMACILQIWSQPSQPATAVPTPQLRIRHEAKWTFRPNSI